MHSHFIHMHQKSVALELKKKSFFKGHNHQQKKLSTFLYVIINILFMFIVKSDSYF